MLKQRALSATLWSAVEQIGARGLSTIFMLVFARFLSAEDFGIFAAATLIIGFGSTLAQLGLNTVVVQRIELNTSALSAPLNIKRYLPHRHVRLTAHLWHFCLVH